MLEDMSGEHRQHLKPPHHQTFGVRGTLCTMCIVNMLKCMFQNIWAGNHHAQSDLVRIWAAERPLVQFTLAVVGSIIVVTSWMEVTGKLQKMEGRNPHSEAGPQSSRYVSVRRSLLIMQQS